MMTGGTPVPQVCRACPAFSEVRLTEAIPAVKSSTIQVQEKVSEAQGRHREVSSEGSVEQRSELMDKNRIRGTRDGPRGLVFPKPNAPRSQSVYPEVYSEGRRTYPGRSARCPGLACHERTGEIGRFPDRRSEVSRGRSKADPGRESPRPERCLSRINGRAIRSLYS